jgi:hypothetical protein
VNDTSSLLSDKPWIWAIFPLVLIVVVAILGVFLRIKRQQTRRANAEAEARLTALGLDPDQVRDHLQREGVWRSPDASGTGANGIVGIRTPGGIALTMVPRGWGRNGRWAWANGFYGPHRAPEEGLNELGEAPPPYIGKPHGDEEEGEMVPMHNLQAQPTRASVASGESARSTAAAPAATSASAESSSRPAAGPAASDPAPERVPLPASPTSPAPPASAATPAATAAASPVDDRPAEAPPYVQPPPYTGGPRPQAPRAPAVDPLLELMRPRSVVYPLSRHSTVNTTMSGRRNSNRNSRP